MKFNTLGKDVLTHFTPMFHFFTPWKRRVSFLEYFAYARNEWSLTKPDVEFIKHIYGGFFNAKTVCEEKLLRKYRPRRTILKGCWSTKVPESLILQKKMSHSLVFSLGLFEMFRDSSSVDNMRNTTF